MSYIDRNLLPNEEISHRTKKHIIIFLVPMIWTIATLLCLFSENNWLVTIAFLPGIAALLTWAQQGLTYLTSEFVVTNKRIMMREGFFFRHTNELRLATISNIAINQSLVGQLLNYGTIIISPFGGENDIFSEIDGPFEFQKAAHAELDKVTR